MTAQADAPDTKRKNTHLTLPNGWGLLLYICLIWPLAGVWVIEHSPSTVGNGWIPVIFPVLGPAILAGALALCLRGVRYIRQPDRGRAAPSLSRDLSNLSVLVCCQVIFDVILVVTLETRSEWWEYAYGQRALTLFSMALGIAALFRMFALILHGPPRENTMKTDETVVSMGHRALGVAVLIPATCTLFLMIDYELRGSPMMSPGALVGLLCVTGLGLRSATAGKVGHWARSPWEVQVRRASLIVPWRLALVGALGTVGIVFAGGPLFYSFEALNAVMEGLYYILLLPTGIALCLMVLGAAYRYLPTLWRHQSAYRQLMHDRAEVLSWSATQVGEAPEGTSIELRLSTGSTIVIEPPHDSICDYLVAKGVHRDEGNINPKIDASPSDGVD